ncbi:MAG TPA: phosphomannomutase/phosphoglucomutase, partial [Acidimicrobiales bacterium]|nr:phosphomannomutase/phosphoglucomutase [Acidimicrobiales bacterium]
SGEINTEVSSPSDVVAKVRERLEGEGVATDELDGLSADFGSWWFNLRASNTEPLLRLNVEDRDEDSLREHVAQVVTMIKELS